MLLVRVFFIWGKQIQRKLNHSGVGMSPRIFGTNRKNCSLAICVIKGREMVLRFKWCVLQSVASTSSPRLANLFSALAVTHGVGLAGVMFNF